MWTSRTVAVTTAAGCDIRALDDEWKLAELLISPGRPAEAKADGDHA